MARWPARVSRSASSPVVTACNDNGVSWTTTAGVTKAISKTATDVMIAGAINPKAKSIAKTLIPMTVSKLKSMAVARSLKVSGSKSDLVCRIANDIACNIVRPGGTADEGLSERERERSSILVVRVIHDMISTHNRHVCSHVCCGTMSSYGAMCVDAGAAGRSLDLLGSVASGGMPHLEAGW